MTTTTMMMMMTMTMMMMMMMMMMMKDGVIIDFLKRGTSTNHLCLNINLLLII